jgi:predicted transcriptional regulator of viral defense system
MITSHPDLPAYVSLDEVAEVAGLDRQTLRRHLKRHGAIRRIGNEYHHVDTAVLAQAESALYHRLLQRRMQHAFEIEEGVLNAFHDGSPAAATESATRARSRGHVD